MTYSMIMAIIINTSKNRKHPHLQTDNKSTYISLKNNLEKVNGENAVKALTHTWKQGEDYLESVDKSFSKLPEYFHKKYMTKNSPT